MDRHLGAVVTAPNHEASRFTSLDRQTIARTIAEYVDRRRTERRQAGLPARRLTLDEGMLAARLAYNAIGCTIHDLRTSELNEVDDEVAKY